MRSTAVPSRRCVPR